MAVTQPGRQIQPTSPQYRAYLVRLWRDGAHEPWRASAQSVQSGELIRFATLPELFTFLDIHTADGAQPGQPGECSSSDSSCHVYRSHDGV